MVTRRLGIAGVLGACLLVAACAEQPGDGVETPEGEADAVDPGDPADQVDPVDLIGSWTVVETAEDPEQIVRIAWPELRVWLECGTVAGSWRADQHGLFVAHVSSSTGQCAATGDSGPAWLRSAASFEPDGDARVLRDEYGTTVARLLPGAEPTAGPDLAPSMVEPPEVTDEVQRALSPAEPVPAGLTPAGPDVLSGRWVPADDSGGGPEPAHLELEAGGDWRGSDGCNGTSGRWIAAPDGTLLAVSGPTTLVACDGAPVGGWLSAASRAALDGETLVLLDAQGEQLGQLVRD